MLYRYWPVELVIIILRDNWSLISTDKTVPSIKLFKVNFTNKLFGTPMAYNLSPIVTGIVINTLLKSMINKLNFQVPFHPKDRRDEICHIFHEYNTHIRFTIEKENESSVPFFETLALRTSGKIVNIDWFIKLTSSGRF